MPPSPSRAPSARQRFLVPYPRLKRERVGVPFFSCCQSQPPRPKCERRGSFIFPPRRIQWPPLRHQPCAAACVCVPTHALQPHPCAPTSASKPSLYARCICTQPPALCVDVPVPRVSIAAPAPSIDTGAPAPCGDAASARCVCALAPPPPPVNVPSLALRLRRLPLRATSASAPASACVPALPASPFPRPKRERRYFIHSLCIY